MISEQADRLLKEVGAYIGSAQQFTFHADITFDHVLPSGKKLQFSAAEEVGLQRPGHLYVEWNGDLGARQFWYDGKSVTLYDPATPFFASEAAPLLPAAAEAPERVLESWPKQSDLIPGRRQFR